MHIKTCIALALGVLASKANAQVPTCTLTPSSTNVTASEVVIFKATCAPAATSYLWTGPGIPSSTSVPSVLTTAPSVAGAYLFTVKGVNAAGSGMLASATMTVGTSAPPPPPPPPNPPVPAPPAPPTGSVLPAACPTSYQEPTKLTKSTVDQVGTPVTATLLNGAVFAWMFSPRVGLKVARVEMTSDNYIDGKDVSISPCAGDFATTLPKECSSPLTGSTMFMVDVDNTVTQQRCHLVAGAKYYVNVRMSSTNTGSIVTVKAQEFR